MPVKLLNQELVDQIQDIFAAQLTHQVEIIYFGKSEACEACEDTHQLLEEISALSDKLHLSEQNIDENSNLAHQYQVDHAPSLVICGREEHGLLDYGIRFIGIPSGYEFSSLIQAILLVSKRDSRLSIETRNELKSISVPVNLKVFTTPT